MNFLKPVFDLLSRVFGNSKNSPEKQKKVNQVRNRADQARSRMND